MKFLEKFENLEIAPNDVILVRVPLEQEITKLHLSDRDMDAILRDNPTARPLIVARVGSNVNSNPELLNVQAGDYVFVDSAGFYSGSTQYVFDKERGWKTAYQCPAFVVKAKIIDNSKYVEQYEGIIIAYELMLEEKAKRLSKGLSETKVDDLLGKM